MLPLLLLTATCFLAYANGANDNFKGVASLFGSDTAGYGGALAWATVTTFLGSAASVVLAERLLTAFSGKGLVPPDIAGGELFLLSVASGAAGTVGLATVLGFPISTTHALVGAIVGAGGLAAGSALDAGMLVSTFVVPLLASPLGAVLLAGALYRALHRTRRAMGVERDACVCVAEPLAAIGPRPGSGAVAARTSLTSRLVLGGEHMCRAAYGGRVVGVRWQKLVDGGHFLSAGVVSFARGLNDTPKIAALLLVVHFVDVEGGLIVVGLTIAIGGLISARRVALTMSEQITTMSHGQGFAANLATGFLVISASRLGLPVSTTHVSVGSLFGIGLTTGQANLGVVRKIVLAWVVTLPCAAMLAALVYFLAAIP
jgi:PiT family inorganic phosphate transporter